MNALPIPPMSTEELHEAGEALSWGAVALARATGAGTSTAFRWWSGARPVPPNIAAHLRLLRDFHRANPFPPAPKFVRSGATDENEPG